MIAEEPTGGLLAGGQRRAARSSAGFTLIELLVVVAIIALLISILLPSLSQARQQAKSVKCMANLRQLGMTMVMYSHDSGGDALPYINGNAQGVYWTTVFDREYLSQTALATDAGGRKTLMCPNTRVNPVVKDETTWSPGTARDSWAAWGDASSYGVNCWLQSDSAFTPPNGEYFRLEYERDYFFQNLDAVRWPSEVPAFADSIWVGSWPDRWDMVPEDLTLGYHGHSKGRLMGRFCVDRHQMKVNVVYVDGSAHPVPLHVLWAQRWHNKYEPRYLTPQFQDTQENP